MTFYHNFVCFVLLEVKQQKCDGITAYKKEKEKVHHKKVYKFKTKTKNEERKNASQIMGRHRILFSEQILSF